MKKNALLFFATITLAAAGYAAGNEENCYQLSKDGENYTANPEVFCMKAGTGTESGKFSAVFYLGSTPADKTTPFLQFNSLRILSRSHVSGFNKDTYGLYTTNDFAAEAFQVRFNGTIEGTGAQQTETGTLAIGGKKFQYRKAPAST